MARHPAISVEMHGKLIADFLLSAVPVPLVDFLEGDVEAIGELFDELGRPVGVPAEALLQELPLLVIQPMSGHFSFFMQRAAALPHHAVILRS